MPVITHRRASEMRVSRRRLSAGAVGGYPSFVPITMGRNNSLLRGGNAFVVSRQVSSTKRPVEIPKLSTNNRDTEALSSAGTSPILVHMVTDSSPLHTRDPSELPPFPPLKDRKITSPDEAVAASAKHQVESSSMSPVLAESEEASQMDGDKDMEYEQSQGSVIGSSKAADNRDILDLSRSSTGSNNNTVDECIDDELRHEPLPSTEQLILSQSWSTWPTPCHDLYSGSQFSGSQSNGTRSYRVTVSFQYVDMGVPELCGHFTIRGLTTELPELTTYFDAQIIGTGNHSFITNQWDASVDTDRTHWVCIYFAWHFFLAAWRDALPYMYFYLL